MINYSKSTVCKSTEAEVLWIDAVEFFRAIKQYPSTQDFIQSNAEKKQIANITSAAVNTHMQNQSQKSNQKAINQPQDTVIPNNIFLKQMFCGATIPERKINWMLKHKESQRHHKN